MKYYEIECYDIDEGISKFLNENKIPREFITYEVIEQGSKGILGFGKKQSKVMIKFDDFEYLKRRAKVILHEILEKSGFSEFQIEIIEDKPKYIFNIISPDSKLLVGKFAQTLNALQELVDRLINIENYPEVEIVVDVEGYRERVTKHLAEKAVAAAETVKKTGKVQKLPPMITIIRKDIHKIVNDIEGVKTESSGTGDIKTIFIVPSKNNNRKRGNR
ncbi:protein jag [Calditerrivibrio nitroreducens]|uniref:Single-stranded nucleic acid binding R3H domain-containing protein n=1 Tax=Calditerrivibrio nitroreducens (strain DSM 19672 / NBRC 101217 / Yu37-1) TaxID=768670 RepID=E4TI10_CALNY|nr:Jag N-terminal domain-containing protein [Calditerrivibrio nitroreducens]ADR18940.1 single-stranded nucleic acid binding R3H domain-containing protein [Calditerrivibrio nitroreducens DSM 19672]